LFKITFVVKKKEKRMANRKLFGLIGMVLVFGLLVYGCDNGTGTDNGGDITGGEITVSGIQVYDWGTDDDDDPVTFNGNAPINYGIRNILTLTILDVQAAGEITAGKLNVKLPSTPPSAMQIDISSSRPPQTEGVKIAYYECSPQRVEQDDHGGLYIHKRGSGHDQELAVIWSNNNWTWPQGLQGAPSAINMPAGWIWVDTHSYEGDPSLQKLLDDNGSVIRFQKWNNVYTE
jgi:hypothetical protein